MTESVCTLNSEDSSACWMMTSITSWAPSTEGGREGGREGKEGEGGGWRGREGWIEREGRREEGRERKKLRPIPVDRNCSLENISIKISNSSPITSPRTWGQTITASTSPVTSLTAGFHQDFMVCVCVCGGGGGEDTATASFCN